MRDIVSDKVASAIPKLAPPVRRAAAEGPPSAEAASAVPQDSAPTQAPQSPPPQRASVRLPHMISFRVGEDLLSALHNAVQAAKDGGNFRYQSVSDVFRTALTAYLDGMPLTVALAPGSRKKATSCVISDELKARYETLPTRSRSQIIERATRTLLKNGLHWSSPTSA